MKNAYCLLNHELTGRQTRELHARFGAETIAYPPAELSALWSQVPATRELDPAPVRSAARWLSDAARPGDILIVQGEAGSTFMLADWALRQGLVPVHAVTERVAHEEREGETVRRSYVFEHVCFRQYSYYGVK